MTTFLEQNKDAASVAPGAAATGPLVGFFDSWSAAVDAQMRTSAQFGIEYFMQDLDWRQTKAMKDAGVRDAPQLILELEGRGPGDGAQSVSQIVRNDSGYYEDFIPSRSRPYMDTARRYSGQEIDAEFEERLQAYDARILQIRKDHPELDLMTSRGMFERVRRDAQAAEARVAADRRSWGGAFGGFVGGALASLHPGTDPLNFYSLGIGGLGRTAAQRILFQMGAQGAVEGINQVTGVQEERRLLGLSYGVGDASMRVAGTAIGAGVLQGAGELVGAGVRRWFRNTPQDPAPPVSIAQRDPEPLKLPPPSRIKEEAAAVRIEQNGGVYTDIIAERSPLSGIRAAGPRIAADLFSAERQLNDWQGPAPARITPRTANVAFPADAGRPKLDVQPALDNNRAYQMAREQDPQTFNQYEKLTQRRATYRRWLDELAEGRNDDIEAAMAGIERRMAGLQSKLRTTQGKGAKAKLRKEIAEVQADRDELLKASRRDETPDTAQVRRELIKTDEKMRDIAPLVGRAYSRSRGRWSETEAEMNAVWDAYQKGRPRPDVPEDSPLPDYDTAMMELQDRAPILQQSNKVEAGATSADTAKAILAENAKVLDEALEAYRAEVKQLLSTAEDGVLTIQGREYQMNIDEDKMFIPNEDGTGGREVTIREYLEESQKAETELEAISVCSMKRTS